MTDDLETFEPFPKIARLNRECVITEKIDGTNASVLITDDGEIKAASRTRWITPQADNFGFASWVEGNKSELLKLGPGHHFGEWWGSGIQRGYGLKNGERRWSLFNVGRFRAFGSLSELQSSSNPNTVKPKIELPECVGLVPVLYTGIFHTVEVNKCLYFLENCGSMAAGGFKDPEGVVIYHCAAKTLFKVTIKNDSEPKGKQ